MIGYYVHHQGHGHLHRAHAIARHLSSPVAGVSSLPAPDGWAGDWLRLPRDDSADGAPLEPTANERLHWAPLGDPGLRSRMAALSQWLERARPDLVVVDVSVEVALLVRLHGIPVVSVALPGVRGDAAHRLGYDVSSTIIAAWPESAHSRMISGPDSRTLRRIRQVGAISRYPVALPCPAPAQTPRRVVALMGSGGDDLPDGFLDQARECSPSWSWTVLGGRSGTWASDPWPALESAGVVVTHAGENALAEVAAARRPAIVIPRERPHDEQMTTARVLAADPRWPVEVISPDRPHDWERLLTRVSRLDGDGWSGWCDGYAAQRAARAIEQTLQRRQGRAEA